MIRANECIIRIVQYDAFSKDIERLKTKPGKLSKRSLLKRHTPFLDEIGIMKSKTRLQNARKPVNAKLPIVLPAHHHFTKIFIRYFHLKFFHAGRPWLMTTLSTNYVFVGGLNRAIKSVIQSCKQCIERFVESKPQQMANLPYERVTPLPPFQVVGIDFTGAFLLKCSYHRTTKYMKAYACIFVCFSTRAVHIELVPSLLTEDFLNALKCFVSRRGLPATIYSDNGTNFKGCERYLNFNDTEIQRYALSNTIAWKFNPPYTPHRGGIWESAVKSAKRYIPKISENQKFTENELRTLLTQIEGILNTRPLAYSNTGEPDEEILTPGHFLVGRNLNVNLPEPSSPPANIKLSDRYIANQNRIRAFWRIWSQDYLNQLRSRTKWQDEQPNYHVGDLILLRKPNTEPCQWIRAIIIKTFPDEAGLVRTVEVRTSDRLSKVVPIQQIVPLPIAK
ncbi:uncharacterized protein LOC135834138 [Planococcus citri]|uniref:uncharacterized protein LOC135834138 n=1 Tax=Planococcus citri TaxID=170843 RepID=UPI0031F7DCAB